MCIRDRFTTKKNFKHTLIAQDNLKAAKKLKNQLLIKTKSIPVNPYLFRQSIYLEDPQIRDCVFKNCTIVFKIEPSRIIVFGFLKHQQFPTDDDDRITKP